MTRVDAPELTDHTARRGRRAKLGTIGVVFKLFGEQTNGLVSIVEHPFPVGACVPPHLHTREDEYSIVTEGEIGFRSGDREVVLGAGGYITKPRGEAHTMWNAGQGSGPDDRGDQPRRVRALLLGSGRGLRRAALPTPP